jgi:hypothetical protein
MSMPEASEVAPLDDEMLVMDVADTLRRGLDIPANAPRETVLARLALLYAQYGMAVSETVLAEGIAAAASGRFAHVPPRGPAAALARLYVARRRWGPPLLAIVLVAAVGFGAYFFGYRPYTASQAEQARQQLIEGLPAQMDALYAQIFNDTKVQTAAVDAQALRDRGKKAAAAGDRAAADQAIADLTALRDRLEQAYTLRIVDSDGVKPAFWTFPPNNSEATNYYIVVEAVDAGGRVLSLPVTSEETGRTETVSRWGLRVPEGVYDAVIADKQDNGRIQHGLVGFKQDGFLDPDYAVPVLGGAVTQW